MYLLLKNDLIVASQSAGKSGYFLRAAPAKNNQISLLIEMN
jgi:hypothetical protein